MTPTKETFEKQRHFLDIILVNRLYVTVFYKHSDEDFFEYRTRIHPAKHGKHGYRIHLDKVRTDIEFLETDITDVEYDITDPSFDLDTITASARANPPFNT